MKKTYRIIAFILSFSMIFSLFSVAFAVESENDPYPTIVIPGVFQSEVKYLNEDGNEKLNADGSSYQAPFFLDSTNEIVKVALKEALVPLGSLLITQKDKENRCAKAIAKVLGGVLGGKVASDSNGNVINRVEATKYNTNLANLTEHDREYALDQIPLNDYVEQAGFDHLYFYSYMSFGNVKKCAEEVYELIQTAKRESGRDKVNLVPISQGGSIANALMQLYKDRGLSYSDDINRVCYIVPAADGAAVLGDIYHYGLIDDAEVLYGTMIPSLLDTDQQWLAYLVNLLLRIMPNANINKILDMAVDTLISDYISNSTCMWALIPSKDYPDCREKYLSSSDKAEIRKQTDWFYNAQLDSRKNILDAKADGVEFFDIVDYNYPLYQICDSWNKVNGDGIIQLDSTSFGATSVPVGSRLPDDYVQQNTYCTDPEHHNHIDEARIVDASSGILCETTFYFKDQNHEKTAMNDVIIRLATHILLDENFKDVYSEPGYPQFNFSRHSRDFVEKYKEWKDFDPSSLNEADAKEFEEALAGATIAYESTFMPTKDYYVLKDRFMNIIYKIETGTEKTPAKENKFMDLITKVLKFLSDFMVKYFGGNGFSELFKPKMK